jgi:two-component system, response regulator
MSTPILLVEDNPNDLELTLRALRKNHLTASIDVARDGEEALQYLFSEGAFSSRPHENPKVVLLDLKLPKVDGMEVLRRLRGDSRTASIPVVILTSSREERDVVQGYNLGVNSYIVKPVEFDRFMKAVADLGFYWLMLNQPPEPAGTPAKA